MSKNLIDRLEDLASGDGDCIFRHILERIVGLEQQLADSQKRDVMLRDGLKRADDLLRINYDHVSPLVREALAATAGLDGLILCDKEPVCWMHYNTQGELRIVTKKPSWDESVWPPLYRAWEPTK